MHKYVVFCLNFNDLDFHRPYSMEFCGRRKCWISTFRGSYLQLPPNPSRHRRTAPLPHRRDPQPHPLKVKIKKNNLKRKLVNVQQSERPGFRRLARPNLVTLRWATFLSHGPCGPSGTLRTLPMPTKFTIKPSLEAPIGLH